MKLSPQSYGKVLYELTKDAKGKELDNIAEQFVLFLAREQALSKINYIIKEFVAYTKEQTGVKQLKITSARSLPQKEVEQIAKHFGKKVEVEISTDKSLIGGIKIKSKNTILDASIKTQLSRLKKELV